MLKKLFGTYQNGKSENGGFPKPFMSQLKAKQMETTKCYRNGLHFPRRGEDGEHEEFQRIYRFFPSLNSIPEPNRFHQSVVSLQ